MRHRLFTIFAVFLSLMLISACTPKKKSTAPDGGGNQSDPAKGNKWDQMKWDQGKWGFIPKGGVNHA